MPTDPFPLTTNNTGEFSGNFAVPGESSDGPQPVVATQGANSASKTFTVTPSPAPTTQPNVDATTPSSPNLSEKMILPDIFT